MKDGDFAIFYIKDNQLYPVIMDSWQFELLQKAILAVFGGKIKILDEPQASILAIEKN